MDEDIFPEICPKKTYSKPFMKVTKTSESNNVKKTFRPAVKPYDPGVPLTTKVAVEYLLSGKLKTSVCRYCLKVTVGLSELDQIMQIAGTGVMYKLTIREMIACFYPFKARQEDNFPEKICQRCVDRALNAYLFTQQCEQAERALFNCFEDMNDKFNKLDPVDRPKKRGRQKLNPNFNVLYTEHEKVIDYAEPVRNIINLQTESWSNEPFWNDFECKKCWQVLPDLESLLNHEQIHPKYMWYHCRLCGKSFVKINQLKRHFNKVHVQGKKDNVEVEKTFKCNECGNVTESYIQHLQHVEKHKFKTVMKHLIEKKTDQLCLVCLKKSSDLVALDKMVCIHGTCPELVGDKSLYTMLSSTLPDQKSYKYQELHVPHKANIMTITQRKRKFKEIQNVPNIIPREFKLSLPKIITRHKFKTDNFYYFVFCEPQAGDYIINTIGHNVCTQYTKSPRISEITDKEKRDCNVDDKMSNRKEGICVISHFGNRHEIPDENKLVNVTGNYSQVTEMVTDETEPIDLLKNVVNIYKNQLKLPDNVNSDVKNVTDLKESVSSNILPFSQLKQTMALAADFNGEDNILNVKEPTVVDNNLKNDMLFNEVRGIDNPQENIDKSPTVLFKQDNLQDEVHNLSFKDSKPNILLFSNPITLEFDHNTNNLNVKVDPVMKSIFNFSNPIISDNKEINDFKPIKEMNVLKHDLVPVKVKNDYSWIFTKVSNNNNVLKKNGGTDDITDVIVETKEKDCKYCWLFKYLNKCEFCKKPIDEGAKITDKENNINKIIVKDKVNNNNIGEAGKDKNKVDIQPKPINVQKYVKEPKIDKIWQCHVCLTNNSEDLSTCHCCESKKYIENCNCKVTFENGNTFLITTHEKEIKKVSNSEKKVDMSLKESLPLIVMDDATMVDAKLTMQENIGIQMDITKDSNSIYGMDIEMDSENYTLDTKVTSNEAMDVEEAFIPYQKFNPTPTLETNITARIGTNIGTNIQFNIGSNPIHNEKNARKLKRAVRKMPKAFHK